VDFKKNLFWIVIAAVLLLGIGGYFLLGSSIQSSEGKTTDALKSDAVNKVGKIKDLAKRAQDKNASNALLNPEHVKLASEYKARVEAQLKTIQESWKTRKLDVRFTDFPTDSPTKFDNWLSEKRDKIIEAAAKANLQLPADTDKLLFKEPSTDENAADVTRHRAYRVRQLAIVDELVSILGRKYGKQQALKFEPEKDKPENQEMVDVGPAILEKVTVLPSKSWLGKATDSKSAGLVTAEERLRLWTEDALKRGSRQGYQGKSTVPELPYSISSVDVQFITPLHTVPAVVQALESSARYTGVVTRIDYLRASSPFPTPGEAKLATAGPVPLMNTHYQEAPVRVLVSLDLYEYNAAKDAASSAKAVEPAGPKAAPKKR